MTTPVKTTPLFNISFPWARKYRGLVATSLKRQEHVSYKFPFVIQYKQITLLIQIEKK